MRLKVKIKVLKKSSVFINVLKNKYLAKEIFKLINKKMHF